MDGREAVTKIEFDISTGKKWLLSNDGERIGGNERRETHTKNRTVC